MRNYGEAREDSDFIGGSDTVDYEVDGLADEEYSISVTLTIPNCLLWLYARSI